MSRDALRFFARRAVCAVAAQVDLAVIDAVRRCRVCAIANGDSTELQITTCPAAADSLHRRPSSASQRSLQSSRRSQFRQTSA